LLNPILLGAFNAAFHRFSRAGGPRPEGFAHFFYPLDRLRDWNLLYGKPGFLQYQCCIPDPGEEGIAACLDLLSRSKVGAFLSVLKRCGDDHALLPFCKTGYTLALDIPFRGEATLKALDRLDEVVLRHRGRVYLTKDARLPKETFRAMYPEWREFMAAVRQANPDAESSSLMAGRLGLWDP
jgi:FAD/FMN-containing dehydrogenase